MLISATVKCSPVPSLARNSMARLGADVTGLLFGTIVGVVTARWLGPAGKGLLSTLTFLFGFCIQIAIIGLGESAMVAIRQKKTSRQEVLQTSVAILIPATLVGIAVLLGVGRFVFHDDWAAARIPVLVAALAIPVNLLNQLAACVINADERVVFTSALLAASSALILASTWIFVVVAKWAVVGAVLASILGVGVTGLIAAGWLAARGLSFIPRIDRSYLKFAFTYGPKVQMSNLLIGAAARLDVLIVYLLAGQSSAGQYSISLTVGMLAIMLPFALTMASFPRIAGLGRDEAAQLILRINRLTLAASAAAAVIIGAFAPVLIPRIFGKAYAPSVAPAIILLAGGVAASSQYMLARARAAQGEPGLILRSYLLNSAVMVALDFALIPRFGIIGAAFASAAGSFVGLAVSAWGTIGVAGRPVSSAEFLPGISDFHDLAFIPLRVFTSRAPAEVVATREDSHGG